MTTKKIENAEKSAVTKMSAAKAKLQALYDLYEQRIDAIEEKQERMSEAASRRRDEAAALKAMDEAEAYGEDEIKELDKRMSEVEDTIACLEETEKALAAEDTEAAT